MRSTLEFSSEIGGKVEMWVLFEKTRILVTCKECDGTCEVITPNHEASKELRGAIVTDLVLGHATRHIGLVEDWRTL